MLPVKWRDEARGDLRQIISFIAERNVEAAAALGAAIEHASEQLPHFPYMYRPGRSPGTREVVVHPNYILVYRVGADVIEIVAVVHARRNYP